MPSCWTQACANDTVVGGEEARGQRLGLLEAMKMEHVLKAPRDGIVQSVNVHEGDQVIAGFLMVTLEPQE